MQGNRNPDPKTTVTPQIDSNLIRAYIDGELPSSVAETVRAYLEANPEAAAAAEFEWRLKAAVAREMSEAPAAPPQLAAELRAVLDRESAPKLGEPEVATVSPRAAGFIASLSSLIASVARPRPVSFGAVVAVLVLVAASVLFGIFFRVGPQLPPESRQTGIVAAAAEFASQEHDRCASDPDWIRTKLNLCLPDEAAVALAGHFPVGSVTVFDLTDAGYEFVGEGRCDVPGTRTSAHLVYQRRAEGRTPAKLSVFIAEAGQDRPITRCGVELRPGQWHRFCDVARCRKRVHLSTDNTLVYFVVTCDPSDVAPVTDLVGRALLARSQ